MDNIAEPQPILVGFRREDEAPLKCEKILKRGDVFTITRRENTCSFKSVLYIRDHLIDIQYMLDEFLDDNSKSSAFIEGPPGCGKTCFLFLWARLIAKFKKKRVLIVQYSRCFCSFIWICQPGGSVWRHMKPHSPSELEQSVEDILQHMKEIHQNIDVCIHDGVTDDDSSCSNMRSMLCGAVSFGEIGNDEHGSLGKVVHVTSLPVRLKYLHEFWSPLILVNMHSWHLEDYLAAVNREEFLDELNLAGSHWASDKAYLLHGGSMDDDSIEPEVPEVTHLDVQAIVREKYFFAGGSVRFMFCYRLVYLRSVLDDLINRVTHTEWPNFMEQSAFFVPSLNEVMQHFDGKCSPVSKYVMWRAYDRCNDELVKAVRAQTKWTTNVSLRDLAFELEQVELIRSVLESPEYKAAAVRAGQGFVFQPKFEADFDGHTIKGRIRDGTVIWCMKWNQGSFQVAYYKEKKIITLQLRTQDKNSLKLQDVQQLRTVLQSLDVECDEFVHIGIGETTDGRELTFGPAEGMDQEGQSDDVDMVVQVRHAFTLEVVYLNQDTGDMDDVMTEHQQAWTLSSKRSRSDDF